VHFRPSPNLPDIIRIEPNIFKDGRGFFLEMYHKEKFTNSGINGDFVQDNRSRSHPGSLRGLHYQLGKPQGKLVWALTGKVFDVAVDIRKNSPTFGKWFGFTLSGDNKIGLYIPPDFAHGFCVISNQADIYYKCTDFYSPEHERCIRWNDPDLAIDWPIKDPILSEKDAKCPFLKDADLPF
jgi:dTDP-4-dehydrorhamnose 3,5-epimerase